MHNRPAISNDRDELLKRIQELAKDTDSANANKETLRGLVEEFNERDFELLTMDTINIYCQADQVVAKQK